MEHPKILHLLNKTNNSKFVTRKWDIVNDNSKANSYVANEVTYYTDVLKSNLCDYHKAYILGRGDITSAPATQVEFKNCTRITKIDGTTIDDAENLDLTMAIYNLIEYSSNCSGTTGSLWFYSKDEVTN